MKATKYIVGLSAFALASAAYADVTVNITGATAFRSPALLAIKAKYVSSGAAFKFAHDKAAGALDTAGRAIFIGTFPGITGTTTIRCHFTGSVEGIRALTVPADAQSLYYPSSVLNSTAAAVGGAELPTASTSGVAAAEAHIAFSDVSPTSTPYSSFTFQPALPVAGVIVFTMITNEGSTISNVTSQNFRALLTRGFQPLHLFTGDPADTSYVFATGRNDGSGTRTTYLAESGYGITTPVEQYVTTASSSTALTSIQRTPAGGAFASTVWGQDQAGNGGYASGTTLTTDMGKTGAAVTVLDETGSDALGGPIRVDLVTFLSVADAKTAKGNGAILCGYNGSTLDLAGPSGSLSTADKKKITSGAYTAWGYERMYRRNSITVGAADVIKAYDAIKSAIPLVLDTYGIPVDDLLSNRETDGGVVAP